MSAGAASSIGPGLRFSGAVLMSGVVAGVARHLGGPRVPAVPLAAAALLVSMAVLAIGKPRRALALEAFASIAYAPLFGVAALFSFSRPLDGSYAWLELPLWAWVVLGVVAVVSVPAGAVLGTFSDEANVPGMTMLSTVLARVLVPLSAAILAIGVVRALSHPGDDAAEVRAASFEVVGAVPPLVAREPIMNGIHEVLYSERVGDLGVRIACRATMGVRGLERAAPDPCSSRSPDIRASRTARTGECATTSSGWTSPSSCASTPRPT